LNIENKIGQTPCAWKEVFRALASVLCYGKSGHGLCAVVSAKLNTTGKSRAWQVKPGWFEGRRSEIAPCLPVKALERPANSSHLAPRNTGPSSQHSELVLAQVLAVVARVGR
jgi:hypothetical protein